MRFSLKSLMVIILFSALLSSLFASWRSAENDLALEKSLRAGIDRNQVVWLSESPQEREQHLARIREHVQFLRQQQDELRATLEQSFAKSAAQVKIVPQPKQISVLDLPTFPKRGRREYQMWAVHVPKSPEFRVQVDFLDNSTGTELIQNEATLFDDQSSLSIHLNPGLNTVEMEFLYALDEKTSQLLVRHNDEPLLDRWELKAGPSTHSKTVYDYRNQRDYAVTGDKFPTLMKLWPSAGTTGIRIRVERVATRER